MSRSKRKTPIAAVTMATSEKQDKRHANKSLRLAAKTELQKKDSDELTLPMLREVSNVWDMKKEGRLYFNKKKYPKLMRK
jgi:hypothetical protein